MTPTIIVLLISILVFMTIGVPIVWSMALSSFLAILVQGDVALTFIAQRMFTGAEKYSMLAIYFFILAGVLMKEGGLSERLINFSNSLVGHIHGGLSLVVLFTSVFFAAISGSSVATTVAIGSMLYPAMLEQKYPADYAAAIPAVGGTLGIVIPPSLLFVLYGSVTNTSISGLLLSGVIPGVLGGLVLMVIAYIIAKKKDFPVSGNFKFTKVFSTFRQAFLALMMPIIILGGIYAGIFTPTESAAVACVYGLIVSRFVYHDLTCKKLFDILVDCAKSTANIMVLVMGATMFSWILTANNVHMYVSNWFPSHINSPALFLLTVNILLLFLGMVMENGATVLILAPLLTPIAASYNIDPIHFGLIVVFNLAVGQATPPYGVCLFAASNISKRKVMSIGRESLPFIIGLFVTVLVCTYCPILSTWLPNMLK